MKRRPLFLGSVAWLLLLAACNDFVERNLSKSTITLLAPGNGATLSNPLVIFWWDSVPSAVKYEIQVVSPNFSNINYLVVDTAILGGTQFTYGVSPGKYQWRMRAINYGSSTNLCAPDSFTVDSALNIAGQTVQIINPVNNFGTSYVTNQLSVNFNWSPMPYATQYLFSISGGSPFISYHGDTSSTNVTYSFTSCGTYTWSIQAVNSNSASATSSYTLYIDTIHPVVPVATSPANGAVTPLSVNSVTFRWGSQSLEPGLGAIAIADSLYVFNDASLDTLFWAARGSNSGTSLTDSGFVAGHTYYWLISAMDTAGNRSTTPVPYYHFTFQ